MKRARAWLAVWAGWTALALLFAVSNSLTYRSTGRAANWSLTIERSLSEWWLWALLSPAIGWLAARYPLQGPRAARHAALHATAGAVTAIAKMYADRAVFALLTGFWTYVLASTIALDFTIYLGIVAAAHGVEYYRRSRERDQLETRLAEARLQLLGMQLQPHFLFNTLNTIAEMVHDEPDTADAMIAALSDLLRRTLDLGPSQDIPLDEELALVERYLDIQRARFGDRLQVRVEADEPSRRARVPALLLQPLVENAIRHGLAAHVNAGRIAIEARAVAESIVISVVDDGAGSGGGPERTGLGNTRARLAALYGSQAALDIAHVPGGGTRVDVRLPRRG
jgi:two-component system, LytTR family, sensor kinase